MQQTVRFQTETYEPAWEEEAPYTKMAAAYREAAEKLLIRRGELRQQLAVMRRSKAGTAASAKAQTVMEQRISTLTEEYSDTLEIIRQIQPYANREVRP